MQAGRSFFIWFACLSVLLLIFIGARLHPLGYLLAGILAPLPVLLVGGRLGDRGALVLALAGAIFVLALKPDLEGLWQNLGFLSLLLMGVLLVALQQRGISTPQAIILTVLTLNGLALLLLLGQAVYQGMSLQALLAQRGAEIMETVHQVLGKAAAPLLPWSRGSRRPKWKPCCRGSCRAWWSPTPAWWPGSTSFWPGSWPFL